MEKYTKFWMVYGINQGGPTIRHESFELAHAEAKRLARKNPDIKFVVLEAVALTFKQDVVTVSLRSETGGVIDDGIPF